MGKNTAEKGTVKKLVTLAMQGDEEKEKRERCKNKVGFLVPWWCFCASAFIVFLSGVAVGLSVLVLTGSRFETPPTPATTAAPPTPATTTAPPTPATTTAPPSPAPTPSAPVCADLGDACDASDACTVACVSFTFYGVGGADCLGPCSDGTTDETLCIPVACCELQGCDFQICLNSDGQAF